MAYPRLVRAPDPPHDALAERSDDELMTLACSGLRSAFAVLVERHAERLVGLCARFTNDSQLGRELAQDTWVMVWQSRETYRAEGNFTGWLITVARNRCRNQLRRRKSESAGDHELAPAEDVKTAAQLDGLLIEERRRRVRRALAELPVALREALLLRYGEELSYDEMMPIVGAGESTLRSRVHHGLKKLKQKLEGER
jgi:RNA polymerase sigma-70 factor (ECF subfamily)